MCTLNNNNNNNHQATGVFLHVPRGEEVKDAVHAAALLGRDVGEAGLEEGDSHEVE